MEDIREVLKRYPGIEEVKIFGSRALETHRPNSDIDLALWGNLDDTLVSRVRSDLDEIASPYQFDVVAYSLIEHSKLKEHIDRFGKIFYQH